ncbi:MAG: ATP-binding protein, partial [Dehalococcoidales bacterium]
ARTVTFLTNLTLGKKIALLTALGLVFGVGVFSSLGIRAVNEATEAMLQDRLTTARLVADFTDEALGRAFAELENVAGSLGSVDTVDGVVRRLAALQESYSRLSIHTAGIYLIDQAGAVVSTWPGDVTGVSFDLAAYPSIAATLNDRVSATSGLLTAPGSGTPVVFLSAPVTLVGGSGRGALAVAADVARSSIGGFVRPIRLGETGYVEIVDQNGIVVTRTEPGPALEPFEESDHSGRFADLIQAGEPVRGVCHTCHESENTVEGRDVLAFVPLAGADWGVIVRQSEEEALASTRELRQSLFVFGGGLVVVALLLVVVTTRDIGRRIQQLTAAARGIAGGDLVTPVATIGKDEVGILARALDDMRVELRTSYGELEQRTQELSSLLSVSEIMTSPINLDQLLDAVVLKAVEIVSAADGGALLLDASDGSGLEVRSTVWMDSEALSRSVAAQVQLSPGVAGSELASRALEDGTFYPGVRSAITAEIVHRYREIGVLVIASLRGEGVFTDSDRRFLATIADYVAIAIERSQLAREAEEANAIYEVDRLRSEFISSVSHELRTPLTFIKGYCTSMLRENVSWDEETHREFLQIVDDKTDQLRDLIDKLLQSAKLEAGALRLEKEPVLLPRLARRVAEEAVRRDGRHELVFRFAPSFPVVEGDSRLLEQVLHNLVENAVKYSPEGGRIVVSGRVDDGEVRVSVSDEGVGVPPEYRERVFERFYRVDDPATRGIRGSGLGLSIARGHVEAHGGRIWVESANGKGSKFSFTLPLEQSDDGAGEEDDGAAGEAGG